MPLVLTLRSPNAIPLEVDEIRIETVRELTVDRIKALPVQYGNKQPSVGEFFDVSGSCAQDNEIIWEGIAGR